MHLKISSVKWWPFCPRGRWVKLVKNYENSTMQYTPHPRLLFIWASITFTGRRLADINYMESSELYSISYFHLNLAYKCELANTLEIILSCQVRKFAHPFLKFHPNSSPWFQCGKLQFWSTQPKCPLYVIYKFPLAQSNFLLTQPKMHLHWQAIIFITVIWWFTPYAISLRLYVRQNRLVFWPGTDRLLFINIFQLTHWGRDKMAAISQTTRSNPFSWMKIFEFRLRFYWSLFLRVQLTIFQHCFR